MRRVGSFFGGIVPKSAKASTAGTPIEHLKAPETLVVPLLQHSGVEAKPVVAKGDEVLKGQVLAEAGDAVSAPVHSPVSGKVVAIEPRAHQSGHSITAIVIENDGNETWVERKGHPDPVQLDGKTILERIREAGIVGMGGEGYPTAEKLSSPKSHTPDYFIINGCECDPYSTSDAQVMMEYPEDVVLGAKLMAKAAGARKIVFALSNNQREAYSALKAKAGSIEIVTLPAKYPNGGERQLIQAVTGKEVPSGGLPHQAGAIVSNVATARAVALALRDGEPLISRVVTITGKPFAQSGNFMVPIGTPLEYIVQALGGFNQEVGKVVLNGALIGAAQFNLQTPVMKTTTCVIAFAQGESVTPNPSPCIRCARCVDVCPANLLPLKLETFGLNERFDEAREFGALDCIECGACEFICPAKRPLLQYIRFAKMEIIARDKISS